MNNRQPSTDPKRCALEDYPYICAMVCELYAKKFNDYSNVIKSLEKLIAEVKRDISQERSECSKPLLGELVFITAFIARMACDEFTKEAA